MVHATGLTVTVDQGYGNDVFVCLPGGLPGVVVDVGGGTWTSEISWMVKTPAGVVVSGAGSGISDEACGFSPGPTVVPAPTPECEDWYVAMYDSWGDGWGDNTLRLIDCSDAENVLAEGLTVPTGAQFTATVCVPVGTSGAIVEVCIMSMPNLVLLPALASPAVW